MHAQPHDISIRFAAPADRDEVARLAELDSAGRVEGDALVALVDGELRAALALDRDRVIADPFEPTAELATLLRLRAKQLTHDGAGHPHLRALAHALPLVGRHA
jgi:hypothetical protein